MGAWAKNLAPWILAALLLGWIFWEVPAAQAWDAARAARIDLFLPAVLGAVFFWFWLESAAFAYLFSRFNAPLSWAEARSLRGTTYLLTPINWNAATAAIILHLRRSKTIGALESSSTMLFYMGVDLLVLALLTLAGASLLPDSTQVVSLRRIAAGALALQAGIFVVCMAHRPAWRWLERLRSAGILRTHQLAGPRDLAVLSGIRSLYFAGFVGLFWLGAHAFAVPVPLDVATASMPPIIMAGGLPITPAGLGTQQAAMLYFYAPFGESTAILAFGLAFPVAVTLSRCVIGLRYLRSLERLRK